MHAKALSLPMASHSDIDEALSLAAGKVKNGDTGDVAVDFYDRFRDDLATAQVGNRQCRCV